MNKWLQLGSFWCLASVVAAGLYSLIRRRQERLSLPKPSRVIGIDGNNFVVMEIVVHSGGRKVITLVDQGSFEEENRI